MRSLPLLISLFYVASASATTLDFNDLSSGQAIGNSYSSNGYLLTGQSRSPYETAQFYVQNSSSELWTGTPGLVFGEVGAPIELRTIAGGTFDAFSIDI